jgi:putative transposase
VRVKKIHPCLSGFYVLALAADTSIGGTRVVRELVALVRRRGKPEIINSDSGAELTRRAVLGWSQTAYRLA